LTKINHNKPLIVVKISNLIKQAHLKRDGTTLKVLIKTIDNFNTN